MNLGALVEAQRRAFTARPPAYADRLDALHRLERALIARAPQLAAAVSEDFGGRASEETRALELLPVINEIRYARRHLQAWMQPRRAAVQWQAWPAHARVVYQ